MTPRDMDDDELTAAWHRLCRDWGEAPVGSQRRRMVGRVLDDVCDAAIERALFT